MYKWSSLYGCVGRHHGQPTMYHEEGLVRECCCCYPVCHVNDDHGSSDPHNTSYVHHRDNCEDHITMTDRPHNATQSIQCVA